MLDPKNLDFIKRLIQVGIKKRQSLFFNELNKKLRELQLSGNWLESSSTGRKIIHNLLTRELKNRAYIVWESLQRAQDLQITDTLACDLKETANYFITEVKKDFLRTLIERPYFAQDNTLDSVLNSAMNDAREEINIEIDCYVRNLIQSASNSSKSSVININKAESVQIGNHASIQKNIGTEKKGIIKNILIWLAGVIGVIIITDILGNFGWLAIVKRFIYNLWPK